MRRWNYPLILWSFFLDFGLVLGEPKNEIMRLRMKMKKMKTKPFIQFSWSSIGQNEKVCTSVSEWAMRRCDGSPAYLLHIPHPFFLLARHPAGNKQQCVEGHNGHTAAMLPRVDPWLVLWNDPSVKLYNHGEGPYKGLLLVESGYYRFHI